MKRGFFPPDQKLNKMINSDHVIAQREVSLFFSSYPGSEAWVEISAFFFSFFHVQSQIAVWSLKRMRHLYTRKAHGIYRNCRDEKLVRIP